MLRGSLGLAVGGFFIGMGLVLGSMVETEEARNEYMATMDQEAAGVDLEGDRRRRAGPYDF